MEIRSGLRRPSSQAQDKPKTAAEGEAERPLRPAPPHLSIPLQTTAVGTRAGARRENKDRRHRVTRQARYWTKAHTKPTSSRHMGKGRERK